MKTPQQALSFIDSILAQVNMNRADQIQTLDAVRILKTFLDDNLVIPEADEEDA